MREDSDPRGRELWQLPGRLGPAPQVSLQYVANQDIVDMLIRDLRCLARTVDRAAHGTAPRRRAETEEFDRFVAGLAIHLSVEDLVVRPIIRRVLAREGLIEERKVDIHLIVRRLAQARHLDDGARFRTRMHGVRLDLAEHVQRTEIGLLAHAYRVYDEEARRTLARRHLQATAKMLDEITRRFGAELQAAADVDRHFLGWLERIASETLDVESLATPSAIKALPPGKPAPRAAARCSPHDVGDLEPGFPNSRPPLPRPE